MDRLDVILFAARNQGRLVSTALAGKSLGCTQQNASRALKELEKEGFLARQPTQHGTLIKLLPKGRSLLHSYSIEINHILKDTYKLSGKVVSGSGEGKFYTGLKGYSYQFRNKLDMKVFPGTLNLSCNEDAIDAFLSHKSPIHIKGFSDRKRSYGSLTAYLVTIGGIRAAALRPERTHHRHSILELISESNLRRELSLEDGSKVVIE